MKNKLVTALLLLSFILLTADGAVACVGARPHGMGGAFIGVADDINAVYWNPAGLVQLKESAVTWTRTLNNRDVVNYDDFLAVGSYNEKLGLAYAVGYINIDDYYLDYILRYLGYDTIGYVDKKNQWLIFSLAKKITPKLSIGGNIRYMFYDIRIDDYWGYFLGEDSAGFIGLDLSLFYQVDDRFAFGLLIQDINRPKFTLFERKWYYIRNVRPGISYRITDSMLVSASIYDLLEEIPEEELMGNRFRIGIEQKIDPVSIRFGLENGNKTFGLGINKNHFVLDYVILGDDLGDTHMLGFTYKF
ncbi:MAG TPA: hypothetical protein GXX33_00260 [Firmicutes bacterium]|nr:hypothetical protein [Bacillota bacterium]